MTIVRNSSSPELLIDAIALLMDLEEPDFLVVQTFLLSEVEIGEFIDKIIKDVWLVMLYKLRNGKMEDSCPHPTKQASMGLFLGLCL